MEAKGKVVEVFLLMRETSSVSHDLLTMGILLRVALRRSMDPRHVGEGETKCVMPSLHDEEV